MLSTVNKEEKSSYQNIFKATSLFGGVQGLVILISLVRNKAMAVLLGAGGMGFNALMMSVQTFAAQFTNLGLSFGAVPKLSEVYEQENHSQLNDYVQVIRLWSLIAAVLGLLFCVVASGQADNMTFTWGDHTLHYAMLGISVAMLAIAGGETAILENELFAFSEAFSVLGDVSIRNEAQGATERAEDIQLLLRPGTAQRRDDIGNAQ